MNFVSDTRHGARLAPAKLPGTELTHAPPEITMSDTNCYHHQLQVTFTSDNDDAYASIERVTGCARRSGVELLSLRVMRRGVHCHAWLRVGSDCRDAVELFAKRLGALIGLDELLCASSDDRAECRD